MAMIWREKLRTENALIGEKQQRELACQKDDEALRAAEEAEDQRQRAETGFNKAREAINRMLTRVYYNLGQFLSDGMGDFHRAIDPLRRAIELSPETTEYRAMLARAHRRGGELGQALTVLEELIRLEPSCAHGYMERGWVHQEAGNFERFLADAQRAVELDPLCGRCQESLADAHVFLGQSDEALAVLNRALEVPWSGGQYESRGGHYAARSWVYGIRGEIYMSKQMYDAAITDYDKAISVTPDWYRLKRRAFAHFQVSHYAEALADLSRAIELKPDDTSTVTWIPPSLVATCPDETFRAGILALADRAIELTNGSANSATSTMRASGTIGLSSGWKRKSPMTRS